MGGIIILNIRKILLIVEIFVNKLYEGENIPYTNSMGDIYLNNGFIEYRFVNSMYDYILY